jgi:hypothetical protein
MHRNLKTRTITLAQVMQIFFGERTPCKRLADLHPRQGNLLQREQFFIGLQNLSSLHKIGWRSAEKNIPFFKHASSSVASKISMGLCK